jgi:hypothetical protein
VIFVLVGYNRENKPKTIYYIFEILRKKDLLNQQMLSQDKLSKETQECMNKDFKIYRQHHARKNSGIINTEDILYNTSCISSDPVIFNQCDVLKKSLLQLSNEAQNLININ